MQSSPYKHTYYYGWVIVGMGTLVVFACLGLGRFALGMLLPSMGEGLSLSYAQMGYISTGNFIGYMMIVLVCGLLTKWMGSRILIVLGLFLVAGSMVIVSLSQGFWHVLILYFITGVGSGAANVPIMGLVPHWFKRSLRGRAAGFVVIGSGFAIILSGLLIPALNESQGVMGWRISWMVLGIIVFLVATLSLILLKNSPDEMGLSPLGDDVVAHEPEELTPASVRKVLLHLGGIYFLFGFTYVIYATFLVTSLVQERGFSEAVAGQFWMWVGGFSLLSGPVFGSLSDKLGRKRTLILVFCFQITAYVLVALPLPKLFLYCSIILWGSVAWSIPSIMAAAVGDYLGPQRAASAFGTLTFFFGIGQIIGPSLAGILAEKTGTFAWSFWMAAGMAFVAIVLSSLLKKERTSASE